MPNFPTRITALLLIPWLVVDPVFASPLLHRKMANTGLTRYLFVSQAVAPPELVNPLHVDDDNIARRASVLHDMSPNDSSSNGPETSEIDIINSVDLEARLKERTSELREQISASRKYLKRKTLLQVERDMYERIVKRMKARLMEARAWHRELRKQDVFDTIQKHSKSPSSEQKQWIKEVVRLLDVSLIRAYFVDPDSLLYDLVGDQSILGILGWKGQMTFLIENGRRGRRWLAVRAAAVQHISEFCNLIHEAIHFKYVKDYGVANLFELMLIEGMTDDLTGKKVTALLESGTSRPSNTIRRRFAEFRAKRAATSETPVTDVHLSIAEWVTQDLIERSMYGRSVSTIKKLYELIGEGELFAMYADGRFRRLYELVPELVHAREASGAVRFRDQTQRNRFWDQVDHMIDAAALRRAA